MNTRRIAFSDDATPNIIQKVNLLIVALFIVSSILFLLWGDVYSAVFEAFWLALCLTVFNYTRKKRFFRQNAETLYLPSVVLLSILEETAIYMNGGGLQGAAQSLTEDLIKSVPVFFMIALALLLMNKILPMSSGHFFLLGAIQGIIIEVIFGGAGAIFIGGVAGIYGTTMAACPPSVAEKQYSTRENLIILSAGSALALMFVVLGAIIADNLYAFF